MSRATRHFVVHTNRYMRHASLTRDLRRDSSPLRALSAVRSCSLSLRTRLRPESPEAVVAHLPLIAGGCGNNMGNAIETPAPAGYLAVSLHG
jgi:hypothetical protein